MLTAIAGMGCIGMAQTTSDRLPEGDGKQVTERVCAACHDKETAVGARHDKPEWQKVVDDMAARGADATDAELKTIVEYLTKYFGSKASGVKR